MIGINFRSKSCENSENQREDIKMVGNEEWMIERNNNIIYILKTHIIISKIVF